MSEFESQKEIKKNIDNLLKQLRSRSAQDRKKADAMFKKLMSSADEGSISSFLKTPPGRKPTPPKKKQGKAIGGSIKKKKASGGVIRKVKKGKK